MKSRRMGLEGTWVVCAGRKMHTGFEWENHKVRDNLEDTVVAGRIILRYLKNRTGVAGED